MNSWKEIWNKKKDIKSLDAGADTIEEIYREMRRIDGYDAVEGMYSWDDLIHQWNEWNRNLNFFIRDNREIKSVFEVGCGSGPNLLLYNRYREKLRVGGIDYSKSLIEIAKNYIESEELYCSEAINLDTTIKYDAVISYSVFHYFSDYQYAEQVLEKMYEKANHVIAVLDIHDLKSREAFFNYRRSLTPDYDMKYKDLDKLFFDKQFFVDFAEKHQCNIKIDISNTKSYWNNDFVYHCYLYKQER